MVEPKSVPKQNYNNMDDGLKGKIDLSRSVGKRTRLESSILRLTRAVQMTSVTNTPQDVSGLAVR